MHEFGAASFPPGRGTSARGRRLSGTTRDVVSCGTDIQTTLLSIISRSKQEVRPIADLASEPRNQLPPRNSANAATDRTNGQSSTSAARQDLRPAATARAVTRPGRASSRCWRTCSRGESGIVVRDDGLPACRPVAGTGR